jgi:CSLREA domain-containing protein
MRTARRPMSVGIALLLGLASLGARGATITVDSTADSLAVDGNCTLREAIIAANTDAAVDACPAGSGADVVVLPAGTYTLTLVGALENAAATGDLDVTGDLELTGAGAATTIIDGNGTDRVFDVDPASAGVTVSVSGVTIRNGRAAEEPGPNGIIDSEGGGIRNRGMLTVADSVVRSNVASVVAPSSSNFPRALGGGISSRGTGQLRVERCIVRDNTAEAQASGGFNAFGDGGGISATSLDVADSTIAANQAQVLNAASGTANGGGISAGPLTLVGSTVSDNQASVATPSPNAAAVAGGIAARGGTIRNSTISGNAAYSGGGGVRVNAPDTVSFFNATVWANLNNDLEAGGTQATLVFRNSILGNCNVIFGPPAVVGDAHNIDRYNTCGLSGSDQRGVDPLLGPLQDNGGATFTHAPLSGSPAIDNGSADPPGSGGTACEATDQRGVVRPVGPVCDVGAVESSLPATRCADAPHAECQPALSHGAKLALKNSSDDAKDRLAWSWISSAAVPITDLEDPATGANDFTLCVYDGGLRLEVTAPAGGSCGSNPCWKRTSSGFAYVDPFLDPDGLSKVLLRAGAAAGKGRIRVRGKGANLEMPAFPLVTPVRVQLLRRFTSTCWEATFSATSRNDAAAFTARSDP